MHDGHVGGPKQYNDFPLGNIFYFYANIFYCFSPPTWPPCTHSIRGLQPIPGDPKDNGVAAMLGDRTFCFVINHGGHAMVFLHL